ncbi:MAG: FitA-like ribbon-helix-helix domain-containing protein [Tepidiformaceae bacterium]
MAQVIVRELEPDVVERLKLHARENGRSLEAELRAALRAVAKQQTRQEALQSAAQFREELHSRLPTDGTAVIREDRDFGHRDSFLKW